MKKLLLLCVSVLLVLPALPGDAASGATEGVGYARQSWARAVARSASAPHARKRILPRGRAPQRTPDTRASRAPASGGTGSTLAPTASDATEPSTQSPSAGVTRGPAPATAASFLGVLNDTSDPNVDVTPPDTTGAVGPSHVVSVTNQLIRITNRSGSEISVSTLDGFWSELPSPPVAFDPRISYNPIRRRWLMAAVGDGESSSSRVLAAISDTSDPTGDWNLFSVDADSGNNMWADFPQMGSNRDWLVVTTNLYCMSLPQTFCPNGFGPGSFVRSSIYVFRLDNMASGTTAGLYTLKSDSLGFAESPASTFDPSASTMYLVENLTGDGVDEETGIHYGVLRLSKISGAVGSETYTGGYAFPATTARWDDNNDISFDALPQKDTTETIDPGDARMGPCFHRNATLWCAQTIFLPVSAPTRASVQWWQLATSGGILQRGRIDDATSTNHYAYPSIAVNSSNDALVGFSHFSATIHPEAGYAFRSVSDPASTLSTPAVLKAGEATYVKTLSGSDNRWGDYSGAVVDPANDVDLWTVQEYAETHDVDGNSVWATWWGKIAPASRSTTTGGFNGVWDLVNVNSATADHLKFGFGRSTDRPITGDWNGNGSVTVGVVRDNIWYLRNSNSAGGVDLTLGFGRSTDHVLTGDWDGDDVWTPGVHRGNVFYLKQRYTDNVITSIAFGRSTDTPIVGDWDGDGTFEVGVRRGNTFYLRNANGSVTSFAFGRTDDAVTMGDWNGDGTYAPGLLRAGATWYLSNVNGATSSVISFAKTTSGRGVVGNWNGKLA